MPSTFLSVMTTSSSPLFPQSINEPVTPKLCLWRSERSVFQLSTIFEDSSTSTGSSIGSEYDTGYSSIIAEVSFLTITSSSAPDCGTSSSVATAVTDEKAEAETATTPDASTVPATIRNFFNPSRIKIPPFCILNYEILLN